MESSSDTLELAKIFFPYAVDRQRMAQDQGTRFVHYTSADSAMNIIKSQEVWMRKSSCMNDYMEVEHGLSYLIDSYRSDDGTKLRSTLDGMFENLSDNIARWFDSMLDAFRYDTYLLCVSEHRHSEDKLGRLSMWRAYGDRNGVALVLNTAAFFNDSNLAAYTIPVAYLDDATFEDQFRRLVDGIESKRDYLRSLGREKVTSHVFHAFQLAAICTKHPGFEEELEWRVVYSPKVSSSAYLAEDIKTIREIPQTIYKIPLRNIPEARFHAEIPELLDRIIIGPTAYGYARAMRDSFRDLLASCGVKDPEARIFISDIPLR